MPPTCEVADATVGEDHRPGGVAHRAAHGREGLAMAHTYGISEVVGTSTTSIDDAITTAVARASTTVRGLDWFEVTEIRGHLADGAVAHYQVGLKIGFRLEE
jgi:flavin-binding protein dodecin